MKSGCITGRCNRPPLATAERPIPYTACTLASLSYPLPTIRPREGRRGNQAAGAGWLERCPLEGQPSTVQAPDEAGARHGCWKAQHRDS